MSCYDQLSPLHTQRDHIQIFKTSSKSQMEKRQHCSPRPFPFIHFSPRTQFLSPPFAYLFPLMWTKNIVWCVFFSLPSVVPRQYFMPFSQISWRTYACICSYLLRTDIYTHVTYICFTDFYQALARKCKAACNNNAFLHMHIWLWHTIVHTFICVNIQVSSLLYMLFSSKFLLVGVVVVKVCRQVVAYHCHIL